MWKRNALLLLFLLFLLILFIGYMSYFFLFSIRSLSPYISIHISLYIYPSLSLSLSLSHAFMPLCVYVCVFVFVVNSVMRRFAAFCWQPTCRSAARCIATSGRVTNEDRRWWLVHLECAPDVTPGTFIAWLDCCGTHTTKKLIERNIWTIEQVAELDSDQVDELKYKEGCIKMDVVWEHARTIITPLRQREVSGGVESELQSRILELRKKRELERRREELLKERSEVNEQREATLRKLREAIAAKKAALLKSKEDETPQ